MDSQLSCDDARTAIASAAIEAVTELALRLGRVMRPDYVTTWLHSRDIEALDGERPIDVLVRTRSVAQLVSGLEDPGAT